MNEPEEQYERIIRTLEKRIWWLEKKIDAIKFRLNNVPKKFVSDAYTVLNRATPNHKVWSFEEWFSGAIDILETSQFIEKGENHE